MSRSRAAAWPTLVVCAVVAFGASVGAAASARPSRPGAVTAPAAAGARNGPGFAQLRACLGAAERLEALYVIDMSGSNAETDPRGARFEGLESSLVGLAELPRLVGGNFRVDAAVAGFGDDYQPPAELSGWRRVDGPDAAGVGRELRAAAERRWAALSEGKPQNTNYEGALGGGRSSLLAPGSARATCRVLFWFTDGLFDLGQPAATDAASRRMCTPGGLLDRVRRDGISVVALAFVNDAVRRELADPSHRARRGELEAMAVGDSTTQRCGTQPLPEGSRAGVYLEARDAADLPGLFFEALPGDGTQRPLPLTRPVQVEVDPGVRTFQLKLTTTGPARAVAVVAPDGARQSLPTTGVTTAVGAAEATAWRFGNFVLVTVDMPGNGVIGTWNFDPAVGLRSATASLFSGLRLRLRAPRMEAGRQAVVTGTAVDAGGAPADLSVYGKVSVHATQRGPAGSGVTAVPAPARVVEKTAGRFEVQVIPGPSQPRLELQAELRLVTTGGIILAGGTASLVTYPDLPGWFPRLEPNALDLSTVRGRRPVTGQVTLIGSALGTTRVCLDAATDVEVPERAAGTRLSYPAGCYDLAARERRTVQATVVPAASADGPGSAVIPLALTSFGTKARPSRTQKRTLEVRWVMERRPNSGRLALLEVLGILLAVLLPLLALWGVNRSLARFDSGDSRRAAVDVLVDDGGPRRADGAPLLAGDDLRPQFIPARACSLDVPGAPAVLRASAPVNPFGGPSFVAKASAGHRVVSSVPPRILHDGLAAPVTPGLGNLWLLVVSDEELRASKTSGEPAKATLVVIVRRYGRELSEQLSLAVGHEPDWPSLLSALRRAAAASAAAAAPTSASPAPVPGTGGSVKDLVGDDDPIFKDPFR